MTAPDSSASPVEAVQAAADRLRSKTAMQPRVGIVLGTGLGALVDDLEVEASVEYGDIPGFPLSTVESHSGRLIFGTLAGVPVVCMQGRFHLYEGYTAQQITFPVRVMKALGVATLVVSNAAGGMNPRFRRGDLMLITDHINLLGANPLIGPNVDAWGPRFPDMSDPYTPRLREIAEAVALDEGIRMQQGVYVAVSGPNLETRAEYRMLRALGADVVGMSTVPEVIVAAHMGMEVLALSVVTDECFPDCLAPVALSEILEAAGMAEPKMTAVIRGVVARL